jgi:hypothetical protein
MSQFPALRPSGRRFTPGLPPVTSFQSLSGKETRVVTGSVAFGHTASLTFQNLLEPAVKSILDHFYGQQGTVLSFTLPSATWAGWTEYTVGVAADQKWRYSSQPDITAVSPGIMSVSVRLVSLA